LAGARGLDLLFVLGNTAPLPLFMKLESIHLTLHLVKVLPLDSTERRPFRNGDGLPPPTSDVAVQILRTKADAFRGRSRVLTAGQPLRGRI